MLNAGADSCTQYRSFIESELVKQAAERFGSQCIVGGCEAGKWKHEERKWEIFTR